LLNSVIRHLIPGDALKKKWDVLGAKIVITITALAWRVLLVSTFWVRCDCEGLAKFRAEVGRTGRPVLIVANHTSFLDTPLIVTTLPVWLAASSKMFAGNHLFKMPILGRVLKGMRHLSVPFKATSEENASNFQVDQEEMAERMKTLEAHAREVGCVSWFPEGTLNRGDPDKVNVFRAGGFSIPVHVDCEVWGVVMVGNQKSCPVKGLMGRPARISLRTVCITDSTHNMFKKEKDLIQQMMKDDNIDEERAQCLLLANTSRARVQDTVDEMLASGVRSRRIGEEATKQD